MAQARLLDRLALAVAGCGGSATAKVGDCIDQGTGTTSTGLKAKVVSCSSSKARGKLISKGASNALCGGNLNDPNAASQYGPVKVGDSSFCAQSK